MGDAGLARGEELFSAERMLKETLRVYQRVAMRPHVEDDLELTELEASFELAYCGTPTTPARQPDACAGNRRTSRRGRSRRR